ncbi:MAG TPA: M20 family metallopeptidase [Candidatus Aminicenantes bacterium]|nr:M20 family metallopeptidase [Candidatus Aminicenantes bacterium]HRY65904.1 M20 family metallopeptidase [Candidatus Aminicenantes bacterium]HRZ72770.1 M20 family metallopeptidase [Candidatus Aminicenantes bacterium]
MTRRPIAAPLVVLAVLLAAPPLRPAAYPSTPLEKRIKAATDRLAPELIAIRQDLHAHPELGLQETRTSAVVADYFRRLGLEVRTGYAKTGVIGILKGGKPGPVAALRGDMDALPITEEADLPFASKATAVVDGRETGLMHACGHDIHTTVLLGVAAVLSAVRADLPGTVVFVAQPAEECCGGAGMMIADGAFKDIVPQAFYAYHVDDTQKAGRLGYASGFMSANVDGFTLEIKSEGCHGAFPWLCVDPIVAGAQVVTALQGIVSRETHVEDNTVITVGSFHAGSAPNIVPRSARLEATVRSYGEARRTVLRDKITRVVTGICQAAGAKFDLAYEFGTPSVYNDPALVREALAVAGRVLGSREALVEQKPEMGGEDFSAYGKIAPAVMFNLGVVPPDREATAVHSPTFVADEAAIPIGVGLMANIILDHQARAAKAK